MWGALLAVAALAFVVVAVGLWQSRLGARVREDLVGAEVLHREEAVRASLAHRARLAAGSQSMTGELVVTDRAVVFFRRSRVLSLQPIVFIRDARTPRFRGRGMIRLVLDGRPSLGRSAIEGAPAVVLRGVQHSVTFTLTIRTADRDVLMGALDAFASGARR